MLAWRQSRYDDEDDPDPRTPLLQWRGKNLTANEIINAARKKGTLNTKTMDVAMQERFTYVINNLDAQFKDFKYWNMFVQDLKDCSANGYDPFENCQQLHKDFYRLISYYYIFPISNQKKQQVQSHIQGILQRLQNIVNEDIIIILKEVQNFLQNFDHKQALLSVNEADYLGYANHEVSIWRNKFIYCAIKGKPNILCKTELGAFRNLRKTNEDIVYVYGAKSDWQNDKKWNEIHVACEQLADEAEG